MKVSYFANALESFAGSISSSSGPNMTRRGFLKGAPAMAMQAYNGGKAAGEINPLKTYNPVKRTIGKGKRLSSMLGEETNRREFMKRFGKRALSNAYEYKDLYGSGLKRIGGMFKSISPGLGF